MFYKLKNSKVMIGGSQSCGTSNDNSCLSLYDLIQDDDGGYIKSKKKKDKHMVTILAKLTVYYSFIILQHISKNSNFDILVNFACTNI